MRNKLSENGLHYLGYHGEDCCHLSLDALENDSVRHRLGNHSVSERRLDYEIAGKQINNLISRLNSRFKTLRSGNLIRTVFDVEMGAVYYYYVTPNDYLIGVTLAQASVDDCDDIMEYLVTDIREKYHRIPAIKNRELKDE